jgi:uncharacterized protein YbjT (DUF2867 family)
MRVLLIGGTGLVGRLLTHRLLAAGIAVTALARQAGDLSHPLLDARIAPPGQWEDRAAEAGKGAAAAISCLGTTWRKAGSEAAFRAVDRDLLLAFARGARAAGIGHFLAISSVGADPDARAFYLKVKGEAEAGLAALAFPRLDLFRPGLLRGARGADRRVKERLAIALSPLTDFLLPRRFDRFRSIAAGTVAESIHAALHESAPGRFVHHNRVIAALAAGAP